MNKKKILLFMLMMTMSFNINEALGAIKIRYKKKNKK